MDFETNQTYDHAWLAKEVRECLETCEFSNDVNVKIHITGSLKMEPSLLYLNTRGYCRFATGEIAKR